MEITELCKKIGIDTFWELARFKKENCADGQNLKTALENYLADLGEDWCLQ